MGVEGVGLGIAPRRAFFADERILSVGPVESNKFIPARPCSMAKVAFKAVLFASS